MRFLFLIVLFFIADRSKAKRKWELKKLQKTVHEMEDRILHIEEDVREIKSLPVFSATKPGVLDIDPTKRNKTESKNRSKSRSIFRNRFKPHGYRKTYTYETTMMPLLTSLPWKHTRHQLLNKSGRQGGRMNFDRVTTPTPILSSLPWQGFIDGEVSSGASRNVHRGWQRQHNKKDYDLDLAKQGDNFDPGNFSSGSVDSHPKKTMGKQVNMLSMFSHIFRHGHGKLIQDVLKHVDISSAGTGHNQDTPISQRQGNSTFHLTSHSISNRERFFQPIETKHKGNKITPVSHRLVDRHENPATLNAKENGMVNSLGRSPPESMKHRETSRHQHPSLSHAINHGIVSHKRIYHPGRINGRRNMTATMRHRGTTHHQQQSPNGVNLTAPISHRGTTRLNHPSLHSLPHRSGIRMSHDGKINNRRNMTAPKSHRGTTRIDHPSLHSLPHRSGIRMSHNGKINNRRNMTAPISHRGTTLIHHPSLQSLAHRSGIRMSHDGKNNNGRNMTSSLRRSLFRFGLQPTGHGAVGRVSMGNGARRVPAGMTKLMNAVMFK